MGRRRCKREAKIVNGKAKIVKWPPEDCKTSAEECKMEEVDEDAVLRYVAQARKAAPAGLSAATMELLAENERELEAGTCPAGSALCRVRSTASSDKAPRTGRTRGGGPTRHKFTGSDDAHVPSYIRAVKGGALLGSLLCTCATMVVSCKRGLTISTLEKAAEDCYGKESVVSDGQNVSLGSK